MKRIIISLTILYDVFNGALAGEDASIIHEVKQLLAQATDNAEERRLDVFYFAFDNWDKQPEFAQLNEIVVKNWQGLLKNIREIVASSEMHQVIMFRSFGTLPQKDALQCLDTMADLCIAKDIDEEVFGLNMAFYDEHIKDAFALNNKDPRIIETVQKIKIIYAGDPIMIRHCDSMLPWGVKKKKELTILASILIIGSVAAWFYFRKSKQK